jgi:hypothetical protein
MYSQKYYQINYCFSNNKTYKHFSMCFFKKTTEVFLLLSLKYFSWIKGNKKMSMFGRDFLPLPFLTKECEIIITLRWFCLSSFVSHIFSVLFQCVFFLFHLIVKCYLQHFFTFQIMYILFELFDFLDFHQSGCLEVLRFCILIKYVFVKKMLKDV